MTIRLTIFLPALLLGFQCVAAAQAIPNTLWGKWIVKRVVPTTSISCWDDKDARRLIGTELEYSAALFRWQKTITKNPVVEIRTLTAEQFHDENSGRGKLSSQVYFSQLGIKQPQALQVAIHHPDADVAEGSAIPGDSVLVKDRNTILFPVCGLYFEAKRK